MFTEVLFAVTKIRNHPKWSRRDKRIKKMWCIYIHIYIYIYVYIYIYMYIIEYYSAIEKNEIMPLLAT